MHGRYGKILPELYKGRILRKVQLLQDRNKRMLEILKESQKARKRRRHRTLEELAGKIKDGSMCGLGQTAPNPVLTTLKYFRNEYEDHIYNKMYGCICKALISFSINDACKGCTLCSKTLPCWCGFPAKSKKTRYRPGQVHQVRQVLKITCKFGAIEKRNREEEQ